MFYAFVLFSSLWCCENGLVMPGKISLWKVVISVFKNYLLLFQILVIWSMLMYPRSELVRMFYCSIILLVSASLSTTRNMWMCVCVCIGKRFAL